jgi:hypothetical protein
MNGHHGERGEMRVALAKFQNSQVYPKFRLEDSRESDKEYT